MYVRILIHKTTMKLETKKEQKGLLSQHCSQDSKYYSYNHKEKLKRMMVFLLFLRSLSCHHQEESLNLPQEHKSQSLSGTYVS